MALFSLVPNWRSVLIDKPIDARMAEAGKSAVAAARGFVPVDTGKLRDSIGFTYRQSDKVLTVHADMPYAAAVEFGTIRMRAQPYLRPALNAVGRVWGGSAAIDFPTAFPASGKRANPAVARHNAAATQRLRRGASRRATVIFGRHHKRFPDGAETTGLIL